MIGILKGRYQKAASTTPGGTEPMRWVIIAIVSWAEAEVMRSKLESENIPCMLQREAAGAALGITIGPMGEVKVLVPEPLADEALDLLSEGAEYSDSDENLEDDSGLPENG
jgi:hypothetical protein